MDIRQRLEQFGQSLDIELFDIAGTTITLATLVVFLLILVITWILSLVLQRGIVRGFRMRGVTHDGTLGVTRRLTHYLVVLVGIGVGLQTVGINLSALFAAGAVFAIGVGFALQNLTQNFVSGVILLLERSIKPGDVLQVEGRMVKVVTMGIRSTLARTLDDEELIVPNGTLVQSAVTNYTARDDLYRIRCPVGVVYGTDMQLVEGVLERMAGELDWRFKGKDPVVLLTDFADSAVVWEVSVWIVEPWAHRRRRSDLNKAIWTTLKDAEIVIAFPQVDVHFDPPVNAALASMRNAS